VLTRFDRLVLDEGRNRSVFQRGRDAGAVERLLEQGVYSRGECRATAECGLGVVANIDLQQHAVAAIQEWQADVRAGASRLHPPGCRSFFTSRRPVDRFHGIIPGLGNPAV